MARENAWESWWSKEGEGGSSGRFQGLKLFLKAAALARYGFGVADIAFDAVGVGAHHRNPAERQRKLETIPAFEDLAPFHEQTDGHDGRVRTGGEEYRAFLDFMARAARAVHGHAATDPGFTHPAGGGKKGLHPPRELDPRAVSRPMRSSTPARRSPSSLWLTSAMMLSRRFR